MTTTNNSPRNDMPEKDKLAKRVLGRILDENLTPRPRWEFMFKNYSFWGLGAIAVVLGALSVAAMLFEVTHIDWRLAPVTHGDLFTLLLDTAPYLWVLALIVFAAIGYINVRKTNRGYRYRLSFIVLGAVLTSITLGSALYAMGFGEPIEEAIGDHPPFYRPILVAERSWWTSPEKGLIGGQVISVASDTASFVVKDFNGVTHDVSTSDLSNQDLSVIKNGALIRVIGVPTEATSTVFHACFVFPWESEGKDHQHIPPPPLTASTTAPMQQSKNCENLRPYQQIHDIDEEGF